MSHLEEVLNNYRQSYELLDKFVCSVMDRGIQLTQEEINILKDAAAKHKNMIYHIRKFEPNFNSHIGKYLE